MRKFWQRLVPVLLTAAMIMTGCGGGSSAPASTTGAAGSNDATAAAAAASYRDTINIAVAQEAPSLDLHKNSSLIARTMCRGTVWEQLVTLNGNGEAVPELCESVETNADSSEFIFHLRKGVLFHDGSEMTSADVVASMNRWIEGFSTAKSLAGDARFEAVDDYTCKITLANPCVTFLSVIAGSAQPAAITTEEACANEDENGFLKDYIGTGPYKFAEWQLNQYILLEKFADYVPYGDPDADMEGWAGYKHAYTEKLYFWYVQDATTRAAGLQTGQYDCIEGVSSDNYDMVANTGGIKIEQYQGGTVALVFNKKEGVASNEYFRQAVNAATDCEQLLKAVYGDFYDLGSCYMDDAQAFWVTDAGSGSYNKRDVAKAKELLEKAGYNGETFRILTSNGAAAQQGMLVWQEQLKEAGINSELLIYDWATFTQYRTDPTAFDVYYTSFASVPVPSLKLYFGPTYPGWSADETLQKYMTAFNTSASLDEAKAAWETLQGYSWEYLPLINVGHYLSTMGYQEYVEGLNFYSGMYYWNARIPE